MLGTPHGCVFVFLQRLRCIKGDLQLRHVGLGAGLPFGAGGSGGRLDRAWHGPTADAATAPWRVGSVSRSMARLFVLATRGWGICAHRVSLCWCFWRPRILSLFFLC